jgi:hypothetical protein
MSNWVDCVINYLPYGLVIYKSKLTALFLSSVVECIGTLYTEH